MKFNKKSKIIITVLLIFSVGIYFELERSMGKPTFYKEVLRKIYCLKILRILLKPKYLVQNMSIFY